ncbi:MAG TPA: hypothetical protein VGA52_02415 [Anaerolineales bacterium]|jgi:hypothetical protein
MGRSVPQTKQHAQRDQLRTGDLVSVVTLLLVFLMWLAGADLARAVRTRWPASASGSVTSSQVEPSAHSLANGGRNGAPVSLLPD